MERARAMILGSTRSGTQHPLKERITTASFRLILTETTEYDSKAAQFRGTSTGIAVYPNPVSGDQFTARLASNEVGPVQFQLIAADGRTVKSGSQQGGSQQLVVSTLDLQPGLYFLRIASKAAVYTERVVVR